MNGWFPALSADGQHLVAEDGHGSIVLDGRPLFLGKGPPVWKNGGFLFSDEQNPGVYLVSVRGERLAKLHDVPLIELTANATRWAGVLPGVGVFVKPFAQAQQHVEPIPNAGQPCLAADDSFFYRIGDEFVEPACGGGFRAWKQGASVVVEGPLGRAVYPGEGRPRLIQTPSGWVLLSMSDTDLRVRPNPLEDKGWQRITGSNGNLNPSGICTGRTLIVVSHNEHKQHEIERWEQSIDAPRRTFERSPEVPPPQPDSPSNAPMPTPNRFDVVRDEFSKQPPAPNSTESCGEFTRRVARRLYAEDANWGMLTKTPGEAQYQGFAVDALIYKPTQQVIDILGGAEGPNPQPAWQEVPKRDSNHWAVPPLPDSPDLPTPDKPPVPDNSAILAEILARLDKLEAGEVRRDQWQGGTDKAILLLGTRCDLLAARRYRVVLSRDWGHSHRGTVEVIE